MSVLSKSDIARPVRRAETIECEALGGEVIVQALLLAEKLDFMYSQQPGYGHITKLLSLTIVDAEREPIMTAEEWAIWGTDHVQAVSDLFDVASRLSGLNPEAAEKKSQTPTGDSSTG